MLVVEKELGRCFCSEECIREYFQPTVEAMEDELAKLRSPDDFPPAEVDHYLDHQQLTLEDPDEVWMEQTESGDRRYTFISRFTQGEKAFYYVVVCIALDGNPSYVFLRFPTRDENLVDEYRRGTDMRVDVEEVPEGTVQGIEQVTANEDEISRDLPDLERLYSELRQPGDIPRDDFPRYETYIEPTLDDPDEIWQLVDMDGNEYYTFISRHKIDENQAEEENITDEFMLIVVCEPLFDEESHARTFEPVFAFPTLDAALVQYFRKGINSLNKSFGMGWARLRAA